MSEIAQRLERPLDFSFFSNEEQHGLQNDKLHTYTHKVTILPPEQKEGIPWKFTVQAVDFAKNRESTHEATMFKTKDGYFGNCDCAFMTHKPFTGVIIIPCYHLCNIYWQFFHDKKDMERVTKTVATTEVTGFQSFKSTPTPAQQEIALIPTKETDELWMIREQRDDERMLAVMDEMFEAEMVYAFVTKDKKGRKKINIELSWEGVKAMAIEYGGIVTELKHIEDTDPAFIKVYFTATDLISKITVWGAIKQARFSEHGNPNKKAFEMAVSKAQRNAIKNLLPTSRVKPILKKAAKILMEKGHKPSEFTKEIKLI
jgi:hypothetical protein